MKFPLVLGMIGLALVGLLCTGCSPRNRTVPDSSDHPEGSSQNIPISAWSLTKPETDLVEDLRPRGGLRIASVETEGAFLANSSGGFSGFQAEMGRALGEFLGLPVHFEKVKFNQIFAKAETRSISTNAKTAIADQLEIFRTIDLVASDLSSTPERLSMMDLHPVYQTRMILVTPKGREIRQLSDLQKRRIGVFTGTLYQDLLEKIRHDLSIGFDIQPLPFGTDLFAQLQAGKIDSMVYEAQTALLLMEKNPGFNISMPLAEVTFNHWATARSLPLFGALVDKFLLYAKANGISNRAWKATYGVDFHDYQQLLGISPIPAWTSSEQNLITQIRSRGLRVAMDRDEAIYEENADGSISGISYNLVLELARLLDVPLRLHTIQFHEYFDQNGNVPAGAKSDPAFNYRPDLLDQVDLYAGTLSPLPWRQKFLSFISLYPTRMVFVARKDQVQGLPQPGERFALLPDSSYEAWLKTNKLVRPQDLVTAYSGRRAVEMVSLGLADHTISEANLVLGLMSTFHNISFYPADNGLDDLSWAVDKKRPDLHALISKSVKYLRDAGSFDTIWRNYYHVPFSEYLNLLSAKMGGPP